jgi:mannose-6-phosphate isomerase-like protein (cupin superfamily)
MVFDSVRNIQDLILQGAFMPRQLKGRDYFDETALPIAVGARDDPTPREPLHSHDYAELIIIRSGHGRHVVDGCDFAVSAGDVFLLQGQRVHGLADTEGMRVFVVLFGQDRLPLPHAQLRRIPGYQAMFLLEPSYRRKHGFRSRLHLGRTELARVEGIWRDMERECLDEAPGHSIVLLARLLELLVFLSRHYAEIESSEGKALLAVA